VTDPRSVANLILDEADLLGLAITNLSLQKLLYFAHVRSLTRHGRGLVPGCFEAWQFGPVHPVVYRSFKSAEGNAIGFRATARDALSGQAKPLPPVMDDETRCIAAETVVTLGRLPAGTLVSMSHAPGGPWDHIVNKSRSSVALGMRISDDVIKRLSRFHVAAIKETPSDVELPQDAPFAGD